MEIDSDNGALIENALDLAKKYQANGVRSFCRRLNRAKPTWEAMRAFEQTSDGEALDWSDEELKFLINQTMPRGFEAGTLHLKKPKPKASHGNRLSKISPSALIGMLNMINSHRNEHREGVDLC